MDAKTDDRRVRKTKKALRNGLASLMMEKKLKDITVRELADRVDLNRGTFYTHYRDINDLYEKIEEEIFDEVNGILDEFAPVQIGGPPFEILLELVKYMVENAEMCRMMFGENGDMSFILQLGDVIHKKCLRDWMALHEGGDAEKFEFFGSYVVSGCVGVLKKWVETGMKQPPEHMADLIGQMAVQGIRFLENKPSKS
jgi:AcrR family transcriptional regulator